MERKDIRDLRGRILAAIETPGDLSPSDKLYLCEDFELFWTELFELLTSLDQWEKLMGSFENPVWGALRHYKEGMSPTYKRETEE